MLKIKDDIELKELKKFGFIDNEDGNALIYETSSETIGVCKSNRSIYIIAENTMYEVIYTLEILMDLILYGFVEKIIKGGTWQEGDQK